MVTRRSTYVKEEPSLYKVGAYCHGCEHDYGVLEYVSRGEVDNVNEVWEESSEAVCQYFD